MGIRAREEVAIFASTVKWIAIATATGLIVGFAVTLFVKFLDLGQLLSQYKYYFLLLPAGLFLNALVIKHIMPGAIGHGADRVIESIHRDFGKLKPILVPAEYIRTFLTVAVGGSVGKEGPSAQIGGALASIFADIIRLSPADRRKLVTCGISGGFASVFGTPIAGAIFGMEILFSGSMRYDVLLPSFVTGVVSYQVSAWLGLNYFHTHIHVLNQIDQLNWQFFLRLVAAGLLFGFISLVFIETLRFFRNQSAKWHVSLPIKGVVAGTILVLLTLVIGTACLGLGVETIQAALRGEHVSWYDFFTKGIYTGITLSFGGSGGIGTPIFFVGATAGSAFSGLLGLDPAMCAAIGFVSLLAGAANTPIAASIMSAELFGSEVAPYAALCCVISYVASGHRSAYASQVLLLNKHGEKEKKSNDHTE